MLVDKEKTAAMLLARRPMVIEDNDGLSRNVSLRYGRGLLHWLTVPCFAVGSVFDTFTEATNIATKADECITGRKGDGCEQASHNSCYAFIHICIRNRVLKKCNSTMQMNVQNITIILKA